jgi:peptide/nickel transport system substrate-binding protein
MEIIKKQPDKGMHPAVPELQEALRKGNLSRREFLRYATLLGLSVSAASALAACGPAATPTAAPAPTAVPPTAVPPTKAPAPPTAAPTAVPTKAAAGITRGGKLTCASSVKKVTHPAQFSWVTPSNQLRQVAEYLTQTDGNNITHPLLLDNWQVSDDLKTWTLNLRKGIKFNNGDEFTADDVVFTMGQWLNKDVGSSILGLMSYLTASGIEKVDNYTVKLHLDRAQIAVPEHLFHYPALILNHKTFQGDFIKAPHGTGPYTLDTYKESERVLLKARKDYWQKGADGQPLPYLDQMEFIDMGEETSAWIAAIKGGQVDYLDVGDNVGPDFYTGLKDDSNINVNGVPTAVCRVMRMRVDLDPWTDNRVRQALKLCQNREKILSLAYFGQGLQGGDFHVYPKHPDYCDKPVPKYDPQKAKQLLADAGHPNGLDVKLAVGSGWPDIVAYAQILKEDAAAAGFRITVDSMPNSQYWDKWTEVDLGVTPWTHRPLGTMVLDLAYAADDKGKPVSWNESRWVDDEFSKLLAQADATLDVDKRKQIMCQLEQIQMDRGSIGIAWWMNIWMPSRKNVKDVPGHPTMYMLFNQVWKAA